MAWLSSPKPWGMWMKQSPIYSTGLIRGLHQFRQFWQKFSVTFERLIGFHIGFSSKIIRY
ncbi:hypothetical protein Goklo_025138 [Gossypium klotzschianum]|uniref:Uncharacterized protein n=1 Tax=Gossypium klotzschianum TaxID=34286 RepID=A0A7J8W8N1_9ROSI|nr:hypothetical protein [Gossypium klotzschianum]